MHWHLCCDASDYSSPLFYFTAQCLLDMDSSHTLLFCWTFLVILNHQFLLDVESFCVLLFGSTFFGCSSWAVSAVHWIFTYTSFLLHKQFLCLWSRHISSSCIVRTLCSDWLKFVIWWLRLSYYAVATISRLHKIVGLFCKRALKKRLCSAKDTYNLKAPAIRSHPIRLSCPPLLFYGTVSIRHGVFTYT